MTMSEFEASHLRAIEENLVDSIRFLVVLGKSKPETNYLYTTCQEHLQTELEFVRQLLKRMESE